MHLSSKNSHNDHLFQFVCGDFYNIGVLKLHPCVSPSIPYSVAYRADVRVREDAAVVGMIAQSVNARLPFKRFIQGEHRGQSTLLPQSLDD